jgi:N-glycosylase/DNA lyase
VQDFRDVWNRGIASEMMSELLFCVLTPQSKAKSCWAAIERLQKSDLLFCGEAQNVCACLSGVRFHNKKSVFLVAARNSMGSDNPKHFISAFETPFEARAWFAQNIKGYGLKEASHFLRNIGQGESLAILDRHILKNIVSLGIIDKIPPSMTDKNYFGIENKMTAFSLYSKIPMSHLDILLWFKQTGEIFK